MPCLPFVENLVSILANYVKEPTFHTAVCRLHDAFCKHGLEGHRLLGHHLLAFMSPELDAQTVYGRLSSSDKQAVNDLIRALIKRGETRHALSLYQTLEESSLELNVHTFVALLKVCAPLKSFIEGCGIHAEMARKGLLNKDLFVGNTLIDMYAKWGWLTHAEEVFDMLPHRDVVSWTALMSGYIAHECGEEGLHCLEQMQLQGVSPNAFTFVCSLKACGCSGAIEKGREIHAEIERRGLLKTDCIVGNTLVDMYVKLGLLGYAREAFDRLQVRDVVSWTALITGYAKFDLGMEALRCLEQMQAEGVSPNAHTYASSLKACAISRAVDKGRELHAEIDEKGLLRNPVIGSALVDMYTKCGLLAKAQDVHNGLLVHDVITWNSLITGYAKQDLGQHALDCFGKMQLDGVVPNAITYVSVLKACGSVKAIAKGIKVHEEVLKDASLKRDFVVGSALVDMYAKCGLLVEAQEVFDTLSVRDGIAWNALIAGYTSNGCSEEALNRFDKMQSDCVDADAATFVSILNACGSIKALGRGLEIHAEIARKGLFEREAMVGNALVDMYTKCGLLAKAEEALSRLVVRDVVTWTTLISGYATEEHGMEALICFEQMQVEGILPNAVTYACILKACASFGALEKGQEIHEAAAKQGLMESSVVVGSAIVDMYAKCGQLEKAQEVFDKLQKRDVVTWNSLIAGYANHELGKEALLIYDRMREEGVSPNSVTFVSSLKACGTVKDGKKGQHIHSDIDREGLLKNDLAAGNALVDMYAKCGSLTQAQEVFDRLPIRDVITWNALIAGYVNREKSKDALKLYDKMQAEGVMPDALTFSSCLKACSNIGATEKGGELHALIARDRLLKADLITGNALVDFYVKCGLLRQSQEVFDKLLFRDVVSWNTLMSGYVQSGHDEQVFLLYERMREGGERPDLATFLSVLNACSHAGLIDKAEVFFDIMTIDYGLNPTLEHYTCIIDLLGRSGHLGKAIAMIERMHAVPDIVVWHAALDACQKWGSVELGTKAFERAVSLDASDPTAYLCMCKIYANAGMLEDLNRVEVMSVENGAVEGQDPCWHSQHHGVELGLA